MDVLMLSRLQFAVATLFHFLFVPLTLGLSVLVAIMETIYVRTGDEEYRRMAKFWGKLFLINFAIGVVTGITLEFQFGTNWSRYSTYVGDVFGALLAIEATVTFFLESTFIARLGLRLEEALPEGARGGDLAGRDRLEPLGVLDPHRERLDAAPGGLHDPQRPRRGHRFPRGDHAELRGGDVRAHRQRRYVLAGFFVLAISAWHLLRNQNTSFFVQVVPLAANFAVAGTLVVMGLGHLQRLRGRVGPAGQAGRDGVALGDLERASRCICCSGPTRRASATRWRRSRSPGC